VLASGLEMVASGTLQLSCPRGLNL